MVPTGGTGTPVSSPSSAWATSWPDTPAEVAITPGPPRFTGVPGRRRASSPLLRHS